MVPVYWSYYPENKGKSRPIDYRWVWRPDKPSDWEISIIQEIMKYFISPIMVNLDNMG